MEKIEQRYSARNIIIVAVIAELFSSFTLWLIESPIKYALFIIETLTIVTIYVVLSNYDFRFTLKKDIIRRISPAIFFDIALIYLASVLIVLNQFNITESTTRLVLAFVCTSGLSGYALLNVCNLTKYFSKLEILVLSFIASFILSGICTLFFLWTDETARSFIIPSIFVLLGVASSIKYLKSDHVPKEDIHSLSRNIDVLPIALCVAFYAIFFYYIYPNFTLLSGTDISRHYSDSIILSRTPDLYTGFSYVLFHAFGSSLNILSGTPTVTSFLNIQTILNFILPLSVYILAKRFLVNVDRRIPAIAIVFYTMFGNFSFILFTKLKMLGSYGTEIDLLRHVADKTYSGTIYFIQPFSWFVPVSVSFIMFIFALFLLKVQSIPRSKFIPLFTVLVMAMYFTHVTEAAIFAVMLGVYSMVSKNKSLRLDDALLSSLIALILTTIILLYKSIFWTSPLINPGIKISSMLPIILPILLLCICMFWRRIVLHKIHLSRKFVSGKKFYYVLSAALVIVYFFGLLTWFFSYYDSSYDVNTGVVPWFIYPLALGVVGLLALIAILHFGHISSKHSLLFFLCLVAILFVMGKAISFVNANFQFTGYFEKRLTAFVFLLAVPLATLPLIKLIDKIAVKRKFFTIVLSSSIISIIVLLGVSSMNLQSEYWFYSTNSNNTVPQKELQAIAYLKNILQKDSHAFTIAPITSYNFLTFAVTPYQLSNPEVLMYAKNPGLPLFGLNAHGLSHAYIYMHSRDFATLGTNWFTDHLIPTSQVVFSNESVTIYNTTHVSYPRSNSDNHMLVPTDPNFATNSLFYAYDVISKRDSNYTVMFDRDQNAFAAKTVVLSYDPPENKTLPDFYDKFTSLKNWKIISGNWKSSSDGLHGGDVFESPSQIILSPIASKDFTLDTSFRILNTSQTLANYVSVVYSWTDTKNYELAEIAFVRNNVYVSDVTVKDGYTYSDSTWPGNATGLSGKPGKLFNVALSKQGKFEDLFLNGTKYLHRSYSGNPGNSGYLGLSAGRVHDIVFDHIGINKLDKLNLRESSDYLSYVKSGGNLIVFNTHGYGSISNTLFNIENPSYDASKIVMDSGNSLPVNISVSPISAVKNVNSIASYVSPGNKSSILIANAIVGLGKITYVNIYPVIASFNDNKTDAVTLNTIFEKISDLINLDTINANSQRDIVKANLKEIDSYGNISIKSSSLVFPYDQFTKVAVRNNDKEILMKNVTAFNVSGYQYAILNASEISIANGNGFYGNVNLGNSIEISFKNNATLTALSDNNKSSRFDNVSNILIQNSKPIQVYLWQPEVHINGYSDFHQFVGEGASVNLITSRTDLYLPGSISFALFMSDTYTYINNISYTAGNSTFVNDSLQQDLQRLNMTGS